MFLSPIDATSQIHLLTTGQGVYAFPFDIDESTSKRILKKMFHRLDISLHLGVDITAVLIKRKNFTTLELFEARSLKDAAFVVVANFKKGYSFLGKYQNLETGMPKLSGWSSEQVVSLY